jgi:hypothetical protein
LRRTLFVSALLAAVVAPAGAHGHDGGADFSHATVFGPFAPVELGSQPGYSDDVEHVVGHNGFTGGHVAIEGDRLYVGSYGDGMHIFDVSTPAAPEHIGEYTPGLRADAPPDAARFGDRHIAVLNGTRRTHSRPEPQLASTRTDRTEFLDVTDAANPRLLWTFGPDQVDGESHNGDIVDKRRLYLPSGGVGVQGLRIYDLKPLLRARPTAPANLFRGSPTALWESSPYRAGRPVGPPFTHTHDVEVYTDYPVAGLGERDIVLLAEGGSYAGNGNTGSIFVIDITDPANPVALQRWMHGSGPGHHPIRYYHEIQFVDGVPGVALVTDEDLHNGCGSAGGIVALRLSPDLTSATELSEWFIPLGTPAPVCSVHVFSSRDGFVALGSYNAGLQVVDYRDPTQPRRAGFFIAPGATAWGALIHEDVIYVGDMTRGLDVFRFDGFPQAKERKARARP